MDMITVAVNGLTDLAALVPVVQDLSRLVQGYRPCLTLLMKPALLDKLEKGLGDSDEMQKQTWTLAYNALQYYD